MGLTEKLDAFKAAKRVTTKGSLSTVVQLTRAFSQDRLPICQQDYVTDKEGQVKGLGGSNLKAILKEYGIERTLSSEGGRTSRGSMGIMTAYAELINSLPRPVDSPAIEGYWIDEVKKYFAGKPFKLNVDSSCSVAHCVDDLIGQAKKRERENPGTKYAGTVLQHLVAAKLSLIVPELEINGADVADAPTGRAGISPSGIPPCTAPWPRASSWSRNVART